MISEYVIDCEFDGFGGPLLSMALVPMNPNKNPFYEVIEFSKIDDPWVLQNVVPFLNKNPVTFKEFQNKLKSYLMANYYGPIVIHADWPDDIKYFCQSLITGPGIMMSIPDFSCNFINGIKYKSEIPHNALEDAKAIRDVLCLNRSTK